SLLVIAVTWWIDDRGDPDAGPAAASELAGEEAEDAEPSETTTTLPPFEGWSNPALVGEPYPGASVEGLLTFRGNPTRSFHGRGPIPTDATVDYRYPAEGGLCGESTNLGETKVWCGMGWTGQPAVFEREAPDGSVRTWLVFGAYDGAVHFLDAETGERILPSFPTG